ncbi:hypothetical protein Tco_0679559 [Tanacetum coccineum]|uniref:Uncharacterized protein n=1 Tax=Tanacetum coccineum TaxID=301880 RepID=A0ABQ4XI62_9ASTR
MDWLSKKKFVIVCHEKVVRIPLEGDGILRVYGERSWKAAKALMNAKVDEPRISDILVVRDFTDVFPEDLSGLPPQRQVKPGWIRAGRGAPIPNHFQKGSLMLEGASPLSDQSASSRKSEEVITDEPHAGKLAHVVLAGLS